jgi:hypothetical protein
MTAYSEWTSSRSRGQAPLDPPALVPEDAVMSDADPALDIPFRPDSVVNQTRSGRVLDSPWGCAETRAFVGICDGSPIAMPLHDWGVIPGWDGVHQVWMVELLYWIKPRLPAGYRAYIGTTPTFAIGTPLEGRPDLGVRDWPREDHPLPPADGGSMEGIDSKEEEPDVETVVATLAGDTTLLVER